MQFPFIGKSLSLCFCFCLWIVNDQTDVDLRWCCGDSQLQSAIGYVIAKDHPLRSHSALTSANFYGPKVSGLLLPFLFRFGPQLLELRFETQRLTDDNVNDIGRLCPGLRTIVLRNCVHLSDTGVVSLSQCALLEVVDLWGCMMVTDAGVGALARHCTQLRHLSLSQCIRVSDEALCVLARCQRLTHLNLDRCLKISNQGLADLAAHCVPLSHLNLASCFKISNSGVERLFQGLRQPLCSLNLTGCSNLQDSALCSFVERSMDMVQELHLAGCVLLTPLSLTRIACCRALRTLSLTKIKNVRDDVVAAIAAGCPHLEKLYLISCPEGQRSSIVVIMAAFSVSLLFLVNVLSLFLSLSQLFPRPCLPMQCICLYHVCRFVVRRHCLGLSVAYLLRSYLVQSRMTEWACCHQPRP